MFGYFLKDCFNFIPLVKVYKLITDPLVITYKYCHMKGIYGQKKS